jgi:hypothetical protein
VCLREALGLTDWSGDYHGGPTALVPECTAAEIEKGMGRKRVRERRVREQGK